MGYGLPAGVGAKRLWPQREVVVFAGDGDFMMHGQEFATAVQYGLPIIVVLLDNAMYGTIRMHQERHYPGRISATQLKNPDFRGYAEVFGGHGERVGPHRGLRPRTGARACERPARRSCTACSIPRRSPPAPRCRRSAARRWPGSNLRPEPARVPRESASGRSRPRAANGAARRPPHARSTPASDASWTPVPLALSTRAGSGSASKRSKPQ